MPGFRRDDGSASVGYGRPCAGRLHPARGLHPLARPPAGAGARPARRAAEPRCNAIADLAREGVGFRVAPRPQLRRRLLARSARVQLLDIGTPVTNLGAMTCPLARQFARWSARGGAAGGAGAGSAARCVRIESFGTYSCRPVNSQPGARLSEHGRANAVDIGAFVLADGRRITVLDGWNGGDEDVRRFLRAVHQAGCRRFADRCSARTPTPITAIISISIWDRGPYCR